MFVLSNNFLYRVVLLCACIKARPIIASKVVDSMGWNGHIEMKWQLWTFHPNGQRKVEVQMWTFHPNGHFRLWTFGWNGRNATKGADLDSFGRNGHSQLLDIPPEWPNPMEVQEMDIPLPTRTQSFTTAHHGLDVVDCVMRERSRCRVV